MEDDAGPPPLSDLAEAVLRWSDPDQVAELKAHRAAAFAPGCENPSDAWMKGRAKDHPFFKYRKIEIELEKLFLERVMKGELLLSAFTDPITPASRREVLFPELLEVIELDFFHGEAYGPDFKLIKFKVHAADPALEQELARARTFNGNQFIHNANYTRVSIRGNEFVFSGGFAELSVDCTKPARQKTRGSRGNGCWVTAATAPVGWAMSSSAIRIHPGENLSRGTAGVRFG